MKRKQYVAYLLVLPSYLIYLLFVFVPIILLIYFSFTNYDFYKSLDFVGIENYAKLFRDDMFVRSIGNTLIYSVFTITFQLTIGLVMAELLNQKVIGQRFHRIAFYLPNIVSMVAVSMVWLWIYDPILGFLNNLFRSVGLSPQKWLFDIQLALPSIIVMSIWKFIGYNMIIYLAGMQSIPDSLYEAAEIDGASGIQKFFRITIPMLRPITFFLFIIACIRSFNVFEQVNVMTGGGPMGATTTIVHQIYERAFATFEMGYACSMAVFILIVTLTFTVLNLKYGNQGTDTSVG